MSNRDQSEGEQWSRAYCTEAVSLTPSISLKSDYRPKETKMADFYFVQGGLKCRPKQFEIVNCECIETLRPKKMVGLRRFRETIKSIQ